MPAKFTFSAGTDLPEIREEVADELGFITRHVSPLLIELGFPNDLKVVRNVKHEWGEDALLGNSAVIDGAFSAVATALSVDSPQGLNLRLGDEVQIEGSLELMVVVAPAPTATVVNVTRGIKGTTAVAIADNAILKRVGNPAIEDESAPSARSTNRSRIANFTQIFRDVASVTRSMMKADLLFGVEEELEHQIMRIQQDLTRDLARTVISGKAQTVNPEGTTTQARTMNGIIHSILGGSDPSTRDAVGGPITESLLNLLLQDMWSKGGEPDLLVAGPAQRRKLSALLPSRQRFQPGETTLGAVVETFISDFGPIDVLAPEEFMPPNLIMLLDRAKVRMVKLGEEGDPYEVLPLAQEGLTFRREVVGEFGLEILNAGDGGHGLIQNLSTT